MASFQAAQLAAPWLLQGAKRQQEETIRAMGGPSKLQRVDSSQEGWSCVQCGNHNYAARTVCNMRTCGAPKPLEPWTCPACGNYNHDNRPFCNMRTCGVAKPGLSMGQMQAAGGKGGAPPQLLDLQCIPAAFSLLGGAATGGGGGGGPGGSWSCMACGNANFPTRQYCNGRNGTCGIPRWQAEAGGSRGKGASQDAGFDGGKGAISTARPEGSWVCHSCQNVNWPTRATCNGNRGACNMPRSAAMGATGAAAPPQGSWVCILCANVNFPTRMTCNGRSCGRDRSECDGGPPAASHVSTERTAAPEGAWTCKLCGNVNWPNRLVCNKHDCGEPRTE